MGTKNNSGGTARDFFKLGKLEKMAPGGERPEGGHIGMLFQKTVLTGLFPRPHLIEFS